MIGRRRSDDGYEKGHREDRVCFGGKRDKMRTG